MALPAETPPTVERLIRENSRLTSALVAASHCLRSYQHGNTATELAKDMADRLDQLLAELVRAA